MPPGADAPTPEAQRGRRLLRDAMLRRMRRGHGGPRLRKVVTTLRDSQHYVYANEQGLGLHDLNPARVHPELQQWDALWAWLESRTPFAQRAVAVGLT